VGESAWSAEITGAIANEPRNRIGRQISRVGAVAWETVRRKTRNGDLTLRWEERTHTGVRDDSWGSLPHSCMLVNLKRSKKGWWPFPLMAEEGRRGEHCVGGVGKGHSGSANHFEILHQMDGDRNLAASVWKVEQGRRRRGDARVGRATDDT